MNAAVTDVRPVALKGLVLSATEAQQERRARFDKTALAELAKSFASTGQINPITVRPLQGGKFEIVAGERRYLAAGLAKMDSIVCSVRELTDEQVLEVQIIENLQREDLHELAEAEAYEKLVAMGRTPAQIALQVHKDQSYIRKRMRLLALGKKGRKAFYDGTITVAIALILSRIPVLELQDKALDGYTEDLDYHAMTATEFRDWVQREFMTDLSSAPFDIGDATLVPAAGSCATCPKNTLGQGQLFDEIAKKAHCTDQVCFGAKRKAHGLRLIEKAKKTGREVITGKEAKRITADGRSRLHGYYEVSGHVGGVPVKKLIKGADPAKLKLLQLPDTGEVIEVAPASLVDKAKPRDGGDNDWRAAQRAQDKKRQLELTYRAELFKLTLEASVGAESSKDGQLADLHLACAALFDRLHHDGTVRLFNVLGLAPVEKKDRYRGKMKSYPLEVFLGQAKTAGDYWGRLRALSIAGDLEHYSHGAADRKDRLHQLATRAGLKPEKILAGLVAAAKAKKARGK